MNNRFSRLTGKKYLLIALSLLALGAYILADRLAGAPNHADTNVVAAYRDGVITREQIVAHYRMQPPQDQKALRSVEGLQHVVQDLAVHAVVERWAQERQVDTQEAFKRAMKNAADSVTLYDVAQQMHEFEVKVEESEIQKYFDDNRAKFVGKSLTQVKEQIRTTLHAQKEQQVIDDFLKQQRANASIIVNANLLDIPEPSDAELQTYYQSNVEQFRESDRVRVEEIRAKAKDKADRALARIQAGEEFAQVAFETNELSFVPNADGSTESTLSKVEGLTTSFIARMHGATVAQLRALNGLPSDVIRVGDQLALPSGAPMPTPVATRAPLSAARADAGATCVADAGVDERRRSAGCGGTKVLSVGEGDLL